MAYSYERIGEITKNLSAVKKILEKPTNRHTEYAAGIASKAAYEEKDYALAIKYYEKLENNASYPGNKLKAIIGLMRSYTFQEEFGVAELYANRVLTDPLSLDNVKLEAHYVKGKAGLKANRFEDALIEFREVSSQTSGVIGAEAQYSIALIYHLQEEFKKSEDEVRILMKEKAGYDFWVAKALILQAKNSIGLDDYVQAEYTINSVLKGYAIEGDGIIEEANEVMDVILAYKNQDKEIEEKGDDTIEIGDGND